MNFELVSCLLLWAWGGGLWSGSGGGDEEGPHKLCVGFFFTAVVMYLIGGKN